MTTSRPMMIFGVGNDYRMDDGAGLYVARKLDDLKLPGVHTIVGVSDGTDMINSWEDKETVFIIDSVSSGGRPGTVYRFDGLGDALTEDIFHRPSTHAITIPQIIKVAKGIGVLPSELVIYGIEAANFESGQGLSPEVIKSADDVVELIKKEVEAKAG